MNDNQENMRMETATHTTMYMRRRQKHRSDLTQMMAANLPAFQIASWRFGEHQVGVRKPANKLGKYSLTYHQRGITLELAGNFPSENH